MADSDPELRLMRRLQEGVDAFGPKTAAGVVRAVENAVLASRGIPDDAVERAIQWIVARTDARVAAEEQKRKTTRGQEPASEVDERAPELVPAEYIEAASAQEPDYDESFSNPMLP